MKILSTKQQEFIERVEKALAQHLKTKQRIEALCSAAAEIQGSVLRLSETRLDLGLLRHAFEKRLLPRIVILTELLDRFYQFGEVPCRADYAGLVRSAAKLTKSIEPGIRQFEAKLSDHLPPREPWAHTPGSNGTLKTHTD